MKRGGIIEGMEFINFDSMRKVAKAIGIGEGVIRYARNNGRVSLIDLRMKTLRCFS